MPRQWLAVGVCLTCALAVGAAPQQATEPSPNATPVFRSGISYVELDASVLDKSRNPVTGLSAADFTVLEDRQPQKILSFSEINIPDPPPPPVAWMRDVTPDVQANDEVMNGRLVVILLDDAHARNDQANLKRTKAVANLLIDRLGPADRATVLFTRLLGSQDFTNDHAKLRAAVDRFVPFRSPLGCEDCLRYSLDRLEKIATDLAALPGRRKALFYFGEGVPMPDLDGKDDPFMLGEQLKRIFREAQRTNLNIYPIDPSGLTGFDDFGVEKALPPPGASARINVRAPTPSAGYLSSEFYRTVAENTGGLATVNRNDLDSIVVPALRENGAYYLLGYQSQNLKTDGVFRKIEVKVNRPGVTVRARSGYYGAKAEVPKKAVAGTNVSSPELDAAVSALVPSAAIKMQVATAAFAVPGKTGAAVAIALGVRPEPLENLTQVDDVDLFAAAYTSEGAMAASWQQPFRMGAGWTQYELVTRLDLKPGRYELRVSAASKLRGKAGSVFTDIEVPDFSKPLSFSGVVVHAEPALTAPANPDVAALVPIVPTTMRDFAGSQQVTTFLKVYQGGKGKLVDVPLSSRIRDVHNAVVFEAPQTVTADRFDATRAAEYRMALPMEKLAPGPYLLTIEGTLKKDTARRDVRLQVH